ncbi:response regulator [Melioribacteraceae bacterium 4301-Me]|uniref:response regulator n=1 Tax=Pyranulibacter aquaticus TaxID=3163344 RepID=UPI0035972380
MSNKILIVEDDPFTKEFYRLVLTKAGYFTYITENGDEVMERLSSDSFCLVVIDINLTKTYLNSVKIDGKVLYSKIKKNKKLNSMPVLLVTGYDYETAKEGIFFDEKNDYILRKPISDLNSFINIIRKLIDRG